jgi:hypothetical protein
MTLILRSLRHMLLLFKISRIAIMTRTIRMEVPAIALSILIGRYWTKSFIWVTEYVFNKEYVFVILLRER